MGKFNETIKPYQNRATTNEEGVFAYAKTNYDYFASLILTSLLANESSFYRVDNLNEVITEAEKMAILDPEFLAKVAKFARLEIGLRSVSHVLLAVLAKTVKGEEYVKRVIADVCKRPDDMSEVLQFYISQYGKPIPNSLKKGLAKAFLKFDEYQLGKYKGKNKNMSLRDIAKLVHPVPQSVEQNILFGKLIKDELATPDTWETRLSSGEDKQAVFRDLIVNNKIGYLALLRNLRNILESCSSDVIDLACERLQDEKAILKNKVFPFQYYIAYEYTKNLNNARRVLKAIERAMEISIQNIPMFKGHTLIAIDVSGSMAWENINKQMTAAQVGAVVGAMAHSICESAEVVSFDHVLKKVNMYSTSLIENINGVDFSGGGTDISLPFKYIQKKYDTKFDRIIVFSDYVQSSVFNVGYDRTSAKDALKDVLKTNPNIKVHMVDLVGYGTVQVVNQKANLLAGWSNSIFDVLLELEKGTGNFLAKIKNVSL